MEGFDFVEEIGPGEANDALGDAGAGGHGGGLSNSGAVLLDGGNFGDDVGLIDAGNAALDFEAALFKDICEVFGGFDFLDSFGAGVNVGEGVFF